MNRSTQIKIAALSSLIMLIAGCSSTHSTSPDHSLIKNDSMNEFVTQKGTNLYLNSKVFRFSGTNNYYMHYKPNDMIVSVLDDAQELGLNAIRIWGFMEGISHNHTMQPDAGKFTPPAGVKSALERLDFTISEAKKRGIRVVIALTNNWGDFGGMQQYVDWFGGQHHDDFYKNPEIKETFKAYAKHLITHTNQYTGIPLNQDPTIMTWELANEPRAQSDKSGQLLYSWTKEMSEYVNELAPNQLIALGSEGFMNRPGDEDWAYNGNEGVDWERILTLPNINYGTVHLYPEHWGKHNAEQWGTQWLIDHAESAKNANKPVVLEEYGIGKNEPQNRDFIYEKWTNTAYEYGYAGSMFWILTGDENGSPNGLYPDYDGFRIINDGGRTSKIIQRHSREMRGLSIEKMDQAYITFPVDGMKITKPSFTASSYILNYNQNIDKVILRTPTGNIEMTNKNNDGYYTAKLKTEKIGYGEKKLITVATLDNGKRITDKITVKFERPIKGYERGTFFDFTDGDTKGWIKEGTWQASWKNPALEVSHDLGKPMLKLNIVWSGKNDWEELKMRNMRINKFNQHAKLAYDLYIPVNDSDKGGVRPYAALGDGWVKLDTDKHRQSVSELDKITINGSQFYKQHIEINLGNIEGKLPDVFLCIVGDKLALDGAVYLDNIEFLKPIY
ncbi:cellulase family glycosylhydrolase [Vibrio sp. TH_r3]|uniref:cellulase family glycosylhydrolase n=1 Tax=Vibrio sp. TH_r3 TaxID=3082084 RepID=UPI0029534A0A|nr:cellulase family glycosylhydrolase [Vibrio sp. TH_r3]MDV7105107.1 cellulase family glycosylhydrolase [Vibrio sp. TH_r3]